MYVLQGIVDGTRQGVIYTIIYGIYMYTVTHDYRISISIFYGVEYIILCEIKTVVVV